MEKHWTGVAGYPNYEVSTHGEIVNVNTGHQLVPTLDPRTGHLKINLTYEPSRFRTVLLHRIVAASWLDEYEEGLQVDFIDGNRQNCSVINLKVINRGVRGPNRTTLLALRIGR